MTYMRESFVMTFRFVFLVLGLVLGAWMSLAWFIMLTIGIMHRDWWHAIPPMGWAAAVPIGFMVLIPVAGALGVINAGRK